MTEVTRGALRIVQFELGDSEAGGAAAIRRPLAIVFARKGVATEPDAETPYRQYFAPAVFAKFDDVPVPLQAQHKSFATMGIGHIAVDDGGDQAVWRGHLHDTTAARDFVAEIEGLRSGGDDMEASIAFSFSRDMFRTRNALSEHERDAIGADVVYDSIARPLHLATCYRGKLPGTKISLNEFVEQHGEGQALHDDLESDTLRASRARLRARLKLE